jgi:hypothetical protein
MPRDSAPGLLGQTAWEGLFFLLILGKNRRAYLSPSPSPPCFFLLSTGKTQPTAGVALIPPPAAMVKEPARII